MLVLKREEETFRVSEKLPLLPLRDVVVFPYMIVPLLVGRQASVQAIEHAVSADHTIMAVAQKKPDVAEPTSDDLYRVGTACRILQMIRLPDGTIRILVEGLARLKVKRFLRGRDVQFASVTTFGRTSTGSSEIEALCRSARSQFEDYVHLNRRVPDEVASTVGKDDDPYRLACVIAAHLVIKVPEKQSILECSHLKSFLQSISRTLSSELEILTLERKIEGEVRSQVMKNQKEFYLTEQLKAIKRELGEHVEVSAELDELVEAIKATGMPEQVEIKALKEVERLGRMAPMSPEGTVVRNYVDWLVSLPWNVRHEEDRSLEDVERILDEDHYGLQKVKERIVEYLAVLKLVKAMKGPILCLVGPPGVGKTSLGKSIARALGRQFVRMSLGGVRDEAEIRGHRRTYIGSMPGRVVQSIRKAGSRNPVFLLDEVDKMSSDFRGDPASALLEVLDPEQNCTFQDHYLDVEFDLSEVVFICTANVLYSVPPALQDRVEVIRMPGYLEYEKMEIARSFLVPKQLEAHGLTDDHVVFTSPAIRKIIMQYTREAGVRNLEREITSICRKVVKSVVGDKKKRKGQVVIRQSSLHRYLGVEKFPERQIESKNRVGTAAGLAWTEAGGDVLHVEVLLLSGKGELKLTGKMGEVMQESGQAAISYARSRGQSIGLASDFPEKTDIHIHVPEGSIPKDGPSAGITMATALVSALCQIPVRRDVAMTGEITLSGRVLPVGGLNEKLVAASRCGFKMVIVPKANEKEVLDLPTAVRRGLKIEFAGDMDDVLRLALDLEETDGVISSVRRQLLQPPRSDYAH